MRLSLFGNAFVRGVNFYGTLSGPMYTYRVPQIRNLGVGKNGKYAVLAEISPLFQTHSNSLAPWGDYLLEHWSDSIFRKGPFTISRFPLGPLTLLWRCNEVRGLNWMDVVHFKYLALRGTIRTREKSHRSERLLGTSKFHLMPRNVPGNSLLCAIFAIGRFRAERNAADDAPKLRTFFAESNCMFPGEHFAKSL